MQHPNVNTILICQEANDELDALAEVSDEYASQVSTIDALIQWLGENPSALNPLLTKKRVAERKHPPYIVKKLRIAKNESNDIFILKPSKDYGIFESGDIRLYLCINYNKRCFIVLGADDRGDAYHEPYEESTLSRRYVKYRL